MGLNLAPAFSVLANSQDITDKIRQRLVSLTITDESGDIVMTSDGNSINIVTAK